MIFKKFIFLIFLSGGILCLTSCHFHQDPLRDISDILKSTDRVSSKDLILKNPLKITYKENTLNKQSTHLSFFEDELSEYSLEIQDLPQGYTIDNIALDSSDIFIKSKANLKHKKGSSNFQLSWKPSRTFTKGEEKSIAQVSLDVYVRKNSSKKVALVRRDFPVQILKTINPLRIIRVATKYNLDQVRRGDKNPHP